MLGCIHQTFDELSLLNNRTMLSRRTLIGVVGVRVIGAGTIEGITKSSLGVESATSVDATILVYNHRSTVVNPNGSDVIGV